MKTFGLGCLFNIIFVVFMLFIALLTSSYINIPWIIFIPIMLFLFFIAHLIYKNSDENQENNHFNTSNQQSQILTDERLKYVLKSKYDIEIEHIYTPDNLCFSAEIFNMLNIKYYQEEVKPYLPLSAIGNLYDQNIYIKYIKTTYGADKLIYYFKQIKNNYRFNDVVIVTPYPFHYTFQELKQELSKISNPEVQDTLIKLLAKEKINLVVNKSTTPIFNFDMKVHTEYLGEIPFVICDQEKMDGTCFSITYFDHELYIFDYKKDMYIHPHNLTQVDFQEMHK